ncbi:MAG: hypothetical protein PHW76_03165 [Alphaproteobacteria bacterium]|nr:hypothetical protein [Alphaproteobacteria bacterium]
MKKFATKFSLSASRRKGVAAVEFSLTLAILWAPLLLCIIDGTYFMLVNAKVDRTAYTINDIVTQYPSTPSCTTLGDIVRAADKLMEPFSFNPTLGEPRADGSFPTATGYIIVTSVYQDATQGPIIEWQYNYPPKDTVGVATPESAVGEPGDTGASVTLPAGLTLNDNDNVIVTEVHFAFRPLFLDQFLARDLYREVIYKPRLKELLATPAGGCT